MRISKVMIAGLLVALGAHAAEAGCIDRYDRRVWIENDTRETMMRFFASHIHTVTWEEDIFGFDVLYPGQRVLVDIDDCSGYCLYDLKAEFADGGNVVRRGYNVCEGHSWTVYD